jgi:hypothetical protein
MGKYSDFRLLCRVAGNILPKFLPHDAYLPDDEHYLDTAVKESVRLANMLITVAQDYVEFDVDEVNKEGAE